MPDATDNFINGLDLSEAFFHECVEPVLRTEFERVKYSAGLLGSGSEVLGFDTEMSADHHWGPRVMLFVGAQDHGRHAHLIKQSFSEKLPRKFRGFPTSFSDADENENGVQILDYAETGPINHRITVETVEHFFEMYLGLDIRKEIEAADWLSFPEQKLRSIVSGRIFHDEARLEFHRQKFSYYPHDLWLYLLASQWSRIEQEEHLMGRAGSVGDEIGSAIIAARLVRDLMQLSFLMEKTYAPYPKWFGTAFKQLNVAVVLKPLFEQILCSAQWTDREKYFCQVYEYLAQCHNQLGITETMSTKVALFHDRPFLVISTGAFSKAIVARIEDPALRKLAQKPLIGGVSQFSDSTNLQSDRIWRPGLRNLYKS
ncbi:MAG: DUF4037 domain-containing protein [Leptolyngbya sp.]|nr:DUF4037 domain-containing protein [Candidatus Melainabacteria bacterium]